MYYLLLCVLLVVNGTMAGMRHSCSAYVMPIMEGLGVAESTKKVHQWHVAYVGRLFELGAQVYADLASSFCTTVLSSHRVHQRLLHGGSMGSYEVLSS